MQFKRNTMQGYLRNELFGPNVYENVLKDYVKEVTIYQNSFYFIYNAL